MHLRSHGINFWSIENCVLYSCYPAHSNWPTALYIGEQLIASCFSKPAWLILESSCSFIVENLRDCSLLLWQSRTGSGKDTLVKFTAVRAYIATGCTFTNHVQLDLLFRFSFEMATVQLSISELEDAIRHAKILQRHLEREFSQLQATSMSPIRQAMTTLLTTMTSWHLRAGARIPS